MNSQSSTKMLAKKDVLNLSIIWLIVMMLFIGILVYSPSFLRQLRLSDPSQYKAIGLQYYKERKYSQAVDNFRYGLEIMPNNADLNYLLGRSLDGLRRYQEAEKYLLIARQLDTANKSYFSGLTWHYQESNQWEKAENLLQEQLKREPNNLAYLTRIALIYEKFKKPDKAINVYLKVYSLDKRSLEALKGLAINYSLMNQNNKAIEYLSKVVLINPDDSVSWFNLGRLFEGQKNFAKAEEAYKKSQEIDDGNYFNNISLARLYYNRGTQQSILLSEKYFKRAATISPTQGEAYYKLGIINRDYKNNLTDALKYFNQSIDINKDLYSYRELGVTYEKLGRPKEALKAYKKVLEIEPTYPIKTQINRLSK